MSPRNMTPRRLGLAIAIAVVLAIVLLLLIGRGRWWGRTTGDAHDRAGRSGQLLAGSTAEGGASATAAIPRWAIQFGAPARRVAGHVVANNAPLAGAIVRLALEDRDGVLEPVAVTTSGADGAFDFGTQPAASFNVSAEAPKHTAAAVSIAVGNPTAKPDQIVLDLTDCHSRLFGAVLDASGGPVAKAHLRSAGLAGAEADEHGNYSLCVISSFSRVRVDADGYGGVAVMLRLFGDLHYDFVLVPEAVLVGIVVTADDRPVAGARVIASPDPSEQPHHLDSGWAIADSDGHFRIGGLAPGRYRLTAAADGVASSPVDAVARAGTTAHEVKIVVRTVATVRGHVMMAGKPVAGANVAAVRGEQHVGAAVYSQPDGSFVLNDIPFGAIGFSAAPYDVKSPKQLAIAKPEIDNVELDVTKLASIRGHVTRHGRPVPGAEIFCPSTPGPVYADATGAYVVDGLPAGDVRIQAGDGILKAFAMEKKLTLADGEDATVDIELDRAGEVTGTVVDEHGAPVAAVFVRMLLADGSNDVGESMTDAAGRFDVGSLAGGEYQPFVYPTPMAGQTFAPATGDKLATIRVPQDGVVGNVTLAVKNERLAIRGSVHDDLGKALPDVHVAAITRTGFGGMDLPSIMSDTNGRFEIANLARGTYSLHAHAADGGDAVLDNIAAGTDNVVISIPRPGAIDGTLVGFSTPPTVSTTTLMPGVFVANTAIVDGDHFSQIGLSPGRYTVEARAGIEVDGTAVDVRAGETAHLTLRSRGVGKIDGHVAELVAKTPLAGMRCVANLSMSGQMSGTATPDASQQATSDASGHFTMSSPLGNVRVFCFDPDGGPLSVAGTDVEVGAQGPATANVFAVRKTFGVTQGNAGFQIKPLTLPLVVMSADPPVVQLGMRVGDHVITIDGLTLQGVLPMGAMFLVWNHKAGTTVVVGVERGGTSLTFRLPVSS